MAALENCMQMEISFFPSNCLLFLLQIEGVLAAVDATKAVALGKKFKVEGYPSGKVTVYDC